MSTGYLAINYSVLEEEVVCPHCGAKKNGLVVQDYTSLHSREVLVECGACDKLYKIYYKFEKIAKLNEE